jgi:hypothetical protein
VRAPGETTVSRSDDTDSTHPLNPSERSPDFEVDVFSRF